MESLATAILDQSATAFGYAEGLVKDVTPQMFARKPEGKNGIIDTNHPAFCFGHLAIYPARICQLAGIEDHGIVAPEGYEELFAAGKECRDDPDASIYPAKDEMDAIRIGSEIVSQWDRPAKWAAQQEPPEDPAYDPAELYGIIPSDIKKQFDMKEVIARLVDGSRFHEYQPSYGTTLICGYANIWGYKVGILANNGVLFNDSSLKGAHFIELCNQNNTPLLFLQNITGYMIGREYERRGITKDGAKMIMAQSCSRVPKFTVMCNGSFGAGNYGMCGRAFDGRFLFTWPNHQIGVMGGDQAANTLAEVKANQYRRAGQEVDQAEVNRIWQETRVAYEDQLSAYYATSQLWDDGIIDPVDTRNALAIAISASLNAPLLDGGYGVFRF